jgi:hypothetical protein
VVTVKNTIDTLQASDARRIVAEKLSDDPDAGIRRLLDEHSAVTEVTLSGVPY